MYEIACQNLPAEIRPYALWSYINAFTISFRNLPGTSSGSRHEFDFDPNEDPELAQAILMSLKEQQRSKEQDNQVEDEQGDNSMTLIFFALFNPF